MVIHDADSKTPEMLMVVIGYTKDGKTCRTRYAKANAYNGDTYRKEPAEWENPLSHLHDPARFGIPTTQSNNLSAMRPDVNRERRRA